MTIMAFEWKDLRLFKAIAQTGNLSAGAVAMHMTAPSASYRLKNLEYTAGSPLFVRTAKGMRLTPAGDALAKHVDILLADLQALQTEVNAYARNLKGKVRLLANSSALNGFIIPSLARFLAANSQVDVDLKEQDSLSIAGKIQRGEADIGICAGNAGLPDLRSERYALEKLICIASVEHVLAQRESLQFTEMLDYELVCTAQASSNFQFIARQADALGKPVKVRVHVHDFNSVIYLVEAGVGIALVPASIAAPRIHGGSMIGIAMNDGWAMRDLHLMTRNDIHPDGLVSQFSDILLHDPLVAATRQGIGKKRRGKTA